MNIKNTIMLATLILINSSFVFSATAETATAEAPTNGEKLLKEATKKKDKKAPSDSEFNGAQMEKNYARDPEFSSTSSNQEDMDVIRDEASEKNDANALRLLLSSHRCLKLPTKEQTQKCREDLTKNNAKKNEKANEKK